MRHVAGDGEHQIVMLGAHDLDLGAAAPRQNCLELLNGVRDRVSGSGVSTHQRPSNSSAKPDSGPDCSVPAIGMAGNEMHALRHVRGDIAHDGGLHRADIGQDGAGLQSRRDLLGDRAAEADRYAQDDEIGVPHRLRGGWRNRRRSSPAAAAVSTVAGVRASRQSTSRQLARGGHAWLMRRADEADADQGDALEHGFDVERSCAASDELGERGHDLAVLVLGADREAQRARQSIAPDAAQDDAARSSGSRRRRRRRVFGSVGKWMRMKLATLGVTLRPSFSISAVSQAQPLLVVQRRPPRCAPCRPWRQRRRRWRGADRLNGPRMRFSASATAAGQ